MKKSIFVRAMSLVTAVTVVLASSSIRVFAVENETNVTETVVTDPYGNVVNTNTGENVVSSPAITGETMPSGDGTVSSGSAVTSGGAVISPSGVVSEPSVVTEPKPETENEEDIEETEEEYDEDSDEDLDDDSEKDDEDDDQNGKKKQKPAVKNGQKFSYRGLKYKIINAKSRTVSVTGVSDKRANIVIVPGTVRYKNKNYKVTEIGSKAFQKCTVLKKVIVGINIAKIGKQAFYKDSRLKYITVWTNRLETVESNALLGTNKNLKIKVYKKNYTKYSNLFKNKGLITAKVIY